MEDIIDEYLYLVGEQRGTTWKDYLLRLLQSCLDCCSLAKAWHDIDSKLENMEKHLDVLAKAKGLFGNYENRSNENRVKNSESDTHHYYRDDLPKLIDEDDVVGIEKNKSKLLSWLTNSDTCREMTAIAVWGMGGHGKTTLVANVYRNNAVKSHFDCKVWVTVSQNYSVDELLRTMIQEIFKENKNSVPNGIATMTGLELFEIIQKSLQQKRYIIVLDDVWRVDLFNDISRAFVDNNNGSRLVVTSRKHDVARIAKEEHIIELQKLGEKDSWILFCKKAFRKENNNVCPQELMVYSETILTKCQGSPLAITVIGSLLSTKEKSESGWKEVYDCLHWEFEKNPSLDALTSILNLSFDDLPNYLKNCFVYCSIFREDYLIKRKKLILLWVAEGFIEAKSSNNRTMEEEAESYLTQLVDRSMLQVAERNDFGRLKAFRMHDAIREVTLEISKKMRFCMILHGSQSVLDDQTRRLSIQTNDDESLDLTTSLLNLSRLRSLVVFSICNFSSGSVLIRFKTLRVLELQGVQISNLPNEVLALFNLHYLGLRKTKVEQLPNNIQKLQSLETLDLRDSNIVKLPHGVTQLKQLRHLFAYWIQVELELGGSTVVGCLPTLEGSWQWKNLHTLKGVRPNKELVHRLGDMKELRTLRVFGGWKQAYYPELCTSLSKMRNLRNLRLYSDASEGLNFEMLNSPPPLLQKLYLWGRLFEGKMPRFICSCAELTRVTLTLSKLIEDPLPSFGQLPKLAELHLDGAYDGQKLHFKTGWFLNLKRLCLDGLMNLNDIVIEEGAMISLHKLDMYYLIELKMVPHGIEFLTHLKSLVLRKMSKELWEKLRKDDDNEDRQRIRHILNVSIE